MKLPGDNSNDEEWCLSASDLSSFLAAVRSHCLPSLEVITPVDEVSISDMNLKFLMFSDLAMDYLIYISQV